jgi:hypothetical protein
LAGRQAAVAGARHSRSRAPATGCRLARLAAATLAGLFVAGSAGCGHQPRPAALRVERFDLVLLAHTLQQLQAPSAAEVAAARPVWPALAGGLPRSGAPLRRRVVAAERRAAALTLPATVLSEGALTGPAAELAGMAKSYVRLSQRGWRYIVAALAARSPGEATRFLRANAPLYVYCVYDAHYDLSLIGKVLLSAYRHLGGARAFGASLTPAEARALARAYSIPAVRLAPHPGPG